MKTKIITIITILLFASVCMGSPNNGYKEYRHQQKTLTHIIKTLEKKKRVIEKDIRKYKTLKRKQQHNRKTDKPWRLHIGDLP